MRNHDEGTAARRMLYNRYVSTHTHGPSTDGAAWHPVLAHVPTGPGTSLLDLGCGEGSLLSAAKERGVDDVRGVDLSREQVELAHQRGRLFVQQGDLLSFLSESSWKSSCVTTVDVLEHLSSGEVVESAVAIANYLPKDGCWVGQVPNAVSPFFGNYAYGDLTHRSFFTARSIEQLLGIAGLDVAFLGPVGVAPGGGVARAGRRLAFAVIQGAYKAMLAAETGNRRHIVTQNLVFVGRRTSG